MPPVKSPVAALVCGILSWVPGFGWFTAVPAIVLGVKGRRAAREGRTPNGGMATTGLWLGIVNMVVTLMVGILVAMAIPVFLNQRHKGVEASLKSDLKNMAVMQETYIQDHPETLGVAVPATSPGGRVTAPVVFTSSAGNVIAVVVGPDGYCVSGYNPQASVAISPSASKLFRSNEGGLQAEVGTC